MHNGKKHTFHLAFLPLIGILHPWACSFKIVMIMLNYNIPSFLPFQLSNPQPVRQCFHTVIKAWQQDKFPWSSTLKSVATSPALSKSGTCYLVCCTSRYFWTIQLSACFSCLNHPFSVNVILSYHQSIIHLSLGLFSKVCWLNPGISHLGTTRKEKAAITEILTRHSNFEP